MQGFPLLLAYLSTSWSQDPITIQVSSSSGPLPAAPSARVVMQGFPLLLAWLSMPVAERHDWVPGSCCLLPAAPLGTKVHLALLAWAWPQGAATT